MNWRYGGRIPSEEELQLLEQEHEYLENYLKEKIGAPALFCLPRHCFLWLIPFLFPGNCI